MKKILPLAVLLAVFFLPAASRADQSGYTVITKPYRLLNNPANNAQPIALRMDIYLPEPFDYNKQYAGVLYVCGSGWLMPSLTLNKGVDRWSAHGIELAKRGYVSFAISYRGSPLFFYPAPNEDAQYALDLITGQENPEFIEQFCRPLKDVALVGSSSGGNIAALMGTGRAGNNREHVRCIAVYAAPMDMRQSAFLPPQSRLAVALSYLPFQDAATYAEASPLCNVDQAFCPFLLQMGRGDSLLPVSQFDMMQDALQQQAIVVEKHIYSNSTHGFQFRKSKNAEIALHTTVDFISRYLPQPE